MITINTTRFVNVRFVTNVITNLVDVMDASAARGGNKPASKPGSWCADHSDSYRDPECGSEEPERGCRLFRGQLCMADMRLRLTAQRAIARLAAQASPGQTYLRFSAA